MWHFLFRYVIVPLLVSLLTWLVNDKRHERRHAADEDEKRALVHVVQVLQEEFRQRRLER